jgi:hypothetical protein
MATAVILKGLVRFPIVPGPRSFRTAGGAYRRRLAAIAGVLAIIAGGCGTAQRTTTSHNTAGTVEIQPATSTITSTVALPSTTVPPTTTTAPAVYSATVAPVTAATLGATWHPGCPVGPEQLRALTLSYWGFDGRAHTGTIDVNTVVVGAVESVFAQLFADRFPLREVVPQSMFGGDDNAAAAADDTSGFNCRYAVAPGPPQWSVHAFGEAIDVNDVENPYIDGTAVIPPSGAAFENRANVRPGMAVPAGQLVDAFASVGWQWGGRWTDAPDYQHFSATGG